MQENQASIAFLGLAEKAECLFEHAFDLYKWNVLGLRTILASPVYPYRLNGWHIAVALRIQDLQKDHALEIQAQDGSLVGTISLSTPVVEPSVVESLQNQQELLPPDQKVMLMPAAGWQMVFISLGETEIAVPCPGVYNVVSIYQDKKEIVGQLLFGQINPPPFTLEQLSAIKSDPYAAKAVRFELGCKQCPTKMRVYAAFERIPAEDNAGSIWYQDVPDEFKCGCGVTKIQLSSIRRNLFSLLGRPIHQPAERAKIIPLYGQQVIQSLRLQYLSLLSRENVIEEDMQKFIQMNPLILHQFPATRILWKPPFLNAYNADIAIVSPSKELLLIELESPKLRLLNKDGGVSAKLQHAVDQVNSWFDLMQDHRLAILDDFKLLPEEVSFVRGLVIAGRDHPWNPKHLRRLKGQYSRSGPSLLTFDDLAAALSNLSMTMGNL